ncbi:MULTISPECIES: hypothetical protein [Tissierellales]|uniref:Uncharacterized protein n=1 Tax=Acidilutibacter cellobiosedens TaxID=2507161 RepID=A0A410QDZ3_9FIRM|nr:MULTISPECIES: hypothetical protein [Tissierellales]QAT62058.1 hypothetical protein EQM13_10905 [Acidilutibacter cellobiosedens]SCL84919.1 hypothetical protein PP176A_0740 [Sporanaerobacter sp. PP17-6a]
MVLKIQNGFLIKSLQGRYYFFQLRKNRKLVCSIFDNKNKKNRSMLLVEDERIIDFAADIDEEDRIHLIYINNEGHLTHYTFKNEENEKPKKEYITKLDTRSNIYSNLNFKLQKNNIIILYSCSNVINPNIWSIHQIIKSEKIKKSTVINTISEKFFSPFFMDLDNLGNIHLIYRAKDINSNHIYYTYYNVYINKWNPTPEKISTLNNDNIFPYLFIDTQNNIHILWEELINKDYILKSKMLSLTKSNNFKWVSTSIPTIRNCAYIPIMLEENGILKIIFSDGEKIKCICSPDYGLSWKYEKEATAENENMYFIFFRNNSSNFNEKNKINNIYVKLDNSISFYFSEIQEDFNTAEKREIDKVQKEETNKETDEEKFSSVEDSALESFKKETEIKIEEISNYIKDNINILYSKTSSLESKIEEIKEILNKNEKKKRFGLFK